MREQRQKRMRGVIEGVATNAATAQIQGAILGDDGRRYKFTSLNDNRMTYAAAMKVDFQPSDYQAIDVRPIPAAAPPVRQQWEAQPPTPASSVPEAAYLPSKSKALIGLLCIFLGPLGGLIAIIYMGVRPPSILGIVTLTIMILICIVFWPFLIIAWPGFIITGIMMLFVSDEKFTFGIHKSRYHTGLLGRECSTGECDNTLDSWLETRRKQRVMERMQRRSQAE